MRQKNLKSERGQTLVMIAFSTILLCAILGLVVDIGWAYFRRQALHAAVDAAALAGAQTALANSSSGFTCGSNNLTCASTDTACASSPNTTPPLSTSDVACLYAQSNGFTTGTHTTSSLTQRVSYTSGTSSPPPTVPGVGATYWLTVRANEPIPQLFSAILGNTILNTSARATAAIVGTNWGGCVYALDPTMDKAIWETGSGDLEAPCGVWVNSNSAKAVYQTAGAKINTSTAKTQIVGSYYQTGSSTITPNPITGIAQFSDPLGSMATPSYSSTCTFTNFSMSGPGTLNPGTYCGGISISGSGASPVVFNPGMYVMLGGGLNIAGSVGAQGTGITVVLTGNGTYSYKGVSINGSGSYSFSAPLSGPQMSMLFIKDRTQPAALGSTITGTSGMVISGIVYLPNETLTYTGGSNASSNYTILVVGSLKLTGLTYINTNYAGLAGGAPGPTRVRLIE